MPNEESDVTKLDSLLRTTITASIFLILGIRLFISVWADQKIADHLYLAYFAIPAIYIVTYAIFFWSKPHINTPWLVQITNKIAILNLGLTALTLFFFSLSEQLNKLPVVLNVLIGYVVNSGMFVTLLVMPLIICMCCIVLFALSRRIKSKEDIEVEKFKKLILDMHRGFPAYVYFDLDKIFPKETLNMLVVNKYLLKAEKDGKNAHRLGPTSVSLVSAWNTESLSYWVMVLSIAMLIVAIIQVTL